VKRFPASFPDANFEHCARAEIRYVIARKFSPTGRTEIYALAEVRHVIGPLAICDFMLIFSFV